MDSLIGKGTFRQQIEYVKAKMHERGVPLRGGSRFDVMCKTILASDIHPNGPQKAIAFTALRDLQQLCFVLEQLDGEHGDEVTRRLRMIIKDQTTVDVNVNHTTGRDQQAELYVYGICKNAGLKPAFAEPDVVCTLESGRPFGVAVKRAKKNKSLDDRITGGVDQVRRTGHSGCVLIDVTHVFDPDTEGQILAVSDDKYAEGRGKLSLGYMRKHFQMLFDVARGTGVTGFGFICHEVHHDIDGKWGIYSVQDFINVAAFNQRRSREFFEFRSAFLRGFPNPNARAELQNVNLANWLPRPG